MSISKSVTAAGVASGVALLLATALMAQGTAPAAPARGTAPAARGAAPAPKTEGSAPAAPAAMAPVMLGPRGLVPVINRMAATTLHGTIMEITCFRKNGAATVSTPEHLACAKEALGKKEGVVGILTDGVGTFQLAGTITGDNYAKLVPYIGKDVDLGGQEAYISNNFSYHVFEVMKLTPAATKK